MGFESYPVGLVSRARGGLGGRMSVGHAGEAQESGEGRVAKATLWDCPIRPVCVTASRPTCLLPPCRMAARVCPIYSAGNAGRLPAFRERAVSRHARIACSVSFPQ